MERKCCICNKKESDFTELVEGPGGKLICLECLEQYCYNVQEVFGDEPQGEDTEAQEESDGVNELESLLKDLLQKAPSGGENQSTTQLKAAQTIKLFTPRKIKEELDKFVIGQDEAKKVLSVAVYNHYKRINYLIEHREAKQSKDFFELDKANVLLLGPSGSGKTLLAKTLAGVLNVPCAICDATTLTEAGYVGEDVENILLKLIQAADYDIAKAQYGIVYVDEIDKIAKKGENVSITRDVSGEGVQQALLKIVESTVASVPMQGGRKHPQSEMYKIDTTNILFIFGGAFVGLEGIVSRRLSSGGMGFDCALRSNENDFTALKKVTPIDLVKFGLIPEFVGRIPNVVALNEIDLPALVRILSEPKNALIKQYAELFKMEGVQLTFTEDALNAVAEQAIRLKIGARGLRSVMEGAMRELMYRLPDEKTTVSVEITKDDILKYITNS